MFQVKFELSDKEYLYFDLYDYAGRKVANLLESKANAGRNEFNFRTNDLSKGQYFLQIKGDKNTNISKLVFIE